MEKALAVNPESGSESALDHTFDPESPVDIHESHTWVQFPRWAECSECGARDYWPAASRPCAKKAKAERSKPVTLGEAVDLLVRDLARFAEWWKGMGLGDTRPSLEEWAAEFLEFRRIPSAG